MEALSAVGDTYRNFRITRYLPLEELQSTLVEWVHEPTGARVMQIANQDPENLFALSFQTLPDSSNGIAHILEHTVLCGSKKFPVKDPFFSMTRRSLNTYMNALTGQDFTCYPASSQIQKDFYNLLEVYIDAVFYPKLSKESFLQEGHRLAFAEPENGASPLTFQGVVYNEMKGAMNSPDSRLAKALGALLTPDLTYAHNSGGDPEKIPELTREELVGFHEAFYHPSRCLFFFYGNLPIAGHLDKLADLVLESTKKAPLLPPLPLQKRFTAPVHADAFYPTPANEPIEKKTFVAISWLTAPISEQTDLLALSVIASILMDTDASFLKKALLQSGLCDSAEASFDLEMSEVPFTITCKGCRSDAANQIKTLCFQTLEGFISRPLSPEKIDNALHQLEFERTEIGAEGIPFGLTLFFRAALAKQHGIAPEHALLIQELFRDVGERFKDPSFFSSLVRKYFLDNPHYVVLTLKPDLLLEQKEKEAEEKKLKTIRASMSEKEVNDLIAQSKALMKFQEEQENASVDCLPKVTLKDIPALPQNIPLHQSCKDSLSIFHTDCFTNQIFYADLVFDLPEILQEELPLLSLYAKIYTDLGTQGRTYEENLAKLEECTGRASASLSLHPSIKNPEVCKPAFTLRLKALQRKAKDAFGLISDFAYGVDLEDTKRLKEWLLQHAVELESRFNTRALSYAVQMSLSGCSVPAFVQNQWQGLPYFQAIKRWIKEEEWIEKLKQLQKKVLSRPNSLILSCAMHQKEELEKEGYYDLPNRLAKRRSSEWALWTGDYQIPTISSQVHLIASPVAFTAQAFKTVSAVDPDSPLLLLAAELLDNVVLHPEIREKGGAYGSGANYSPATGNFYSYAYRDPHVIQTLKTFEKAFETIGKEDFDEDDLEEAKLGVIQALDVPIPPGQKALTAYSWQRAGLSFADRKAFRGKILLASKQEIAAAAGRWLVDQKKTSVTFLGQHLYEKENVSSAFSDFSFPSK